MFNCYRIPALELFLCALLFLVACGKKESAPPAGKPLQKTQAPVTAPKAETEPAAATLSSPEDPPPLKFLTLPVKGVRHTGDLNQMVKRRNIRALVLLNPIGFFYDKGHPKGVMYESLEELQRFINKKFKTGNLKVKVTFHPIAPSQVEAALTEGLGDLIAYGINITPEREKRVAFSVPFQTDVTQIVVAGPNFGPVSTIEDLGGKQVYANPLTTYYENLRKVNDGLQRAGKKLIDIKAADKNLTEDDLVEMVNARLIPATVTTKQRADFWSKVLDHLTLHPELMIATGGKVGWVMRKNNPRLKQMIDEFAKTRVAGTTFGNVLLRRYLHNTKWVKDSTSAGEMKKFQATVALFRKYADKYAFDYLMLVALGYQESLLDQRKTNRSGAVGIMQVLPKYAAAAPINISNVRSIDGNIHAGVKMLRNNADTYFKDPGIDPLNKMLLAFASYNAGPTRIARLRRKATSMGLDPNVWFGSVELVVAKDIGEETVMYVSNIYKYYVAYKLALEQLQLRGNAKTATTR
ncbi:MAG TPA: lytic transglycosylase F [Bryobacteraceae bacterium]|jgi:membrane-bound lytic murein transglycosylase MltF